MIYLPISRGDFPEQAITLPGDTQKKYIYSRVSLQAKIRAMRHGRPTMKIAYFPRLFPWVLTSMLVIPFFCGLLEVQVRNQSRKGDCKGWRPGSLAGVAKPSSESWDFDMFRPHILGLVQMSFHEKSGWCSGPNCRFTRESDKLIEVNGELPHCHVTHDTGGEKDKTMVYLEDQPRNHWLFVTCKSEDQPLFMDTYVA